MRGVTTEGNKRRPHHEQKEKNLVFRATRPGSLTRTVKKTLFSEKRSSWDRRSKKGYSMGALSVERRPTTRGTRAQREAALTADSNAGTLPPTNASARLKRRWRYAGVASVPPHGMSFRTCSRSNQNPPPVGCRSGLHCGVRCVPQWIAPCVKGGGEPREKRARIRRCASSLVDMRVLEHLAHLVVIVVRRVLR